MIGLDIIFLIIYLCNYFFLYSAFSDAGNLEELEQHVKLTDETTDHSK